MILNKEGLEVSMKVSGTLVAESNKWLLEYCALVSRAIISYAPTWEYCVCRLRVHSKVLQDSQLFVYLVRGYVRIDCSVIRANTSKDESA